MSFGLRMIFLAMILMLSLPSGEVSLFADTLNEMTQRLGPSQSLRPLIKAFKIKRLTGAMIQVAFWHKGNYFRSKSFPLRSI